MAKDLSHKNMLLKLPIISLEQPIRLDKPVVLIPEEEYKELIEDIQDLRSALRAEEEFAAEGGRTFSEYNKHRRSKKR